MYKKIVLAGVIVSAVAITGCASVPMAPKEQDIAMKKFEAPAPDKAGLYVFRNTFVGQALKKRVSLDGKTIGQTANKVYFYKPIDPGKHVLSTESEFGDNSLDLQASAGKNYFIEQYIKIGVFVGGANLRMVTEEEGKKAVSECSLAQEQ